MGLVPKDDVAQMKLAVGEELTSEILVSCCSVRTRGDSVGECELGEIAVPGGTGGKTFEVPRKFGICTVLPRVSGRASLEASSSTWLISRKACRIS
jgi:hypothetical protein